jgi:hypothetical protein
MRGDFGERRKKPPPRDRRRSKRPVGRDKLTKSVVMLIG